MSVSAMTPYQLASEVATLFTLPDVALRACTVMDRPNATAQDLIEIVGIDPNLALTVLKLANSVLYGSRGHIDTLARAIALIGHKALRDLVLATSAVKTFRGIPTEESGIRRRKDGRKYDQSTHGRRRLKSIVVERIEITFLIKNIDGNAVAFRASQGPSVGNTVAPIA